MRRIKLSIPGMGCRRCVREVTSILRDVPGIQTLVADAPANEVVVTGSMTHQSLMAAFADSPYRPVVIASGPDL